MDWKLFIHYLFSNILAWTSTYKCNENIQMIKIQVCRWYNCIYWDIDPMLFLDIGISQFWEWELCIYHSISTNLPWTSTYKCHENVWLETSWFVIGITIFPGEESLDPIAILRYLNFGNKNDLYFHQSQPHWPELPHTIVIRIYDMKYPSLQKILINSMGAEIILNPDIDISLAMCENGNYWFVG